MKIELKTLAKFVLIALELISAGSATDAAIFQKMFRSDIGTLIISNGEMNDIMNIVKSLDGSGLLIKDVGKTTENEARNKSQISQYVIRCIKCYFITKYINR